MISMNCRTHLNFSSQRLTSATSSADSRGSAQRSREVSSHSKDTSPRRQSIENVEGIVPHLFSTPPSSWVIPGRGRRAGSLRSTPRGGSMRTGHCQSQLTKHQHPGRLTSFLPTHKDRRSTDRLLLCVSEGSCRIRHQFCQTIR